MFNVFRFTLQALVLVLVFMLVTLGLDWIHLGHGLNPWIAFPISFVLTWVVVRSLIEDIRKEVRLQRTIIAYRNYRHDSYVDRCAMDHPPHPDHPL